MLDLATGEFVERSSLAIGAYTTIMIHIAENGEQPVVDIMTPPMDDEAPGAPGDGGDPGDSEGPGGDG